MGWPHQLAWVGFLVYQDPTQEAPNQSRVCAEEWPQRGDSKLGDEDARGSRQAPFRPQSGRDPSAPRVPWLGRRGISMATCSPRDGSGIQPFGCWRSTLTWAESSLTGHPGYFNKLPVTGLGTNISRHERCIVNSVHHCSPRFPDLKT